MRARPQLAEASGFVPPGWAGVSVADWNDWRWQLAHAVSTVAELERHVRLSPEERVGLRAAGEGRAFRAGVTPYFLSLVDPGHLACPVRRQIVPTAAELARAPGERADPLGEEPLSPEAALVHRYPDRVLLLATDRCAVYCRHCNRRRRVGGERPTTEAELERAIAYVARRPEIRDVLISGGDPLLLSNERLGALLGRLRRVPHVETLRVGTRAPVVLPMRIDAELCALLRRHAPLYVNTQFNHPRELTPEARAACARLVDAGVPVANQAVLLRGINSSLRTVRRLVRDLASARVRPYYLFQGDPVDGTDHLRTPVEKAVEIAAGLRGWISGMAVPTVVIDAPGGGGKVPVWPPGLLELGPEVVRVRTYRGDVVAYPQPAARDCAVPYDEVFFAGAADDEAGPRGGPGGGPGEPEGGCG